MKPTVDNLRAALREFCPDPDCTDPYPWGSNYLELSDAQYELLPASLVFLSFVRFLRFPVMGRAEKIEWTIPVLFRNVPFVLMHQKFGFRISALAPLQATPDLVSRMLAALRSAIRITEILMEPFAIECVRRGNVTIANRYHLFRRRYEYLREKATEAYSSPAPLLSPSNGEMALSRAGGASRDCRSFTGSFWGVPLLIATSATLSTF